MVRNLAVYIKQFIASVCQRAGALYKGLKMKISGCARSDLQFFSCAKLETLGRGRPEEMQGMCPGLERCGLNPCSALSSPH